MIGVIVHVIVAIIMNLAVAHYRDLLVIDPDNALKGTVARLYEHPLNLQTLDSILLFVIGSVIAVLAVWKAYASDDRYPGYGRMDRLYKRALKRYRDRRDKLVADTQAALRGGFEDVDQELKDLKRHVQEARSIYSSFQTIEGRLKTAEKATSDASRQLLKIYRDENRGIRDMPCPRYFGKYETRGHSFKDMPESNSYDQKMKNLSKLVEDAEKSADQARQKIQDTINTTRKELDIFINKVDQSALIEIKKDDDYINHVHAA